MSTLVYKLDEFNNIRDNGFIFELSYDSLEVINNISEIVGASDYVKTPIFVKREKKRNNKEIDESLKAEFNFKERPAIIEKKEINIVTVTSSLNKLTDKTYDVLFGEINKVIKELVDNTTNEDESIVEESKEKLTQISNYIFTIASSNKFYSKVYARMYNELISEYNIFKTILDDNLEKHLELFNNIVVVSADENYELFCKNNKVNEDRRALSLFISNLYNFDTIECDKIVNIINNMHQEIDVDINEIGKQGKVLEMTENLSLIIINSLDKLIKTDYWIELKDYIQKMKSRKMKDFKSLPSKSIFKYMDINDKIKDLDK
tara:strand:- start:7406 stop:8362 length:957 start_codon:yes stop_codon:yes gene_type:complete